MYGFTVNLERSVDAAVAEVTEALKAEGFGVLSDIDVQGALKAKLGVERGPYRILGACNPQLANRAIEAEPDIGLLLPCNVIVRQAGQGGCVVGFMDPLAVLGLVGRPELERLGQEVRGRLKRVRAALTNKRVEV